MSDYHKVDTHTCLTKRQVEIVTLAARGLKNYAIANELHLSLQTVKNHFTCIYRKVFIIHPPRGSKKRICAIH
jgi:DNA-binding NarL/FixJ family response regulator